MAGSFCWTGAAAGNLPLSFGVQILEWLFSSETAHDGGRIHLSFIELIFLYSMPRP